MSGQTATSAYFPLPGGETYFQSGNTGGNRYYWHKDWLGTVRLATSLGNRGPIFDRAFAPYGEMYDNFGQTGQLSFTGDTQDTFGGIFDTPERELNPTQGRWLSPDPAGAGWNLYAYGTNPNSEVDPSGLELNINGAGVPFLSWFGTPLNSEIIGTINRDSVPADNGGDSAGQGTEYVTTSVIDYPTQAMIDQYDQQISQEQTNAGDWAAFSMVFGTFAAADPYVQAAYALANCSGAGCILAAGIAALAVVTDGESGAVSVGPSEEGLAVVGNHLAQFGEVRQILR